MGPAAASPAAAAAAAATAAAAAAVVLGPWVFLFNFLVAVQILNK